ncbi:MAG: hypothetical protein ACLFTU_08650 [Puniceicoccaceae bacterium]
MKNAICRFASSTKAAIAYPESLAPQVSFARTQPFMKARSRPSSQAIEKMKSGSVDAIVDQPEEKASITFRP